MANLISTQARGHIKLSRIIRKKSEDNVNFLLTLGFKETRTTAVNMMINPTSCLNVIVSPKMINASTRDIMGKLWKSIIIVVASSSDMALK